MIALMATVIFTSCGGGNLRTSVLWDKTSGKAVDEGRFRILVFPKNTSPGQHLERAVVVSLEELRHDHITYYDVSGNEFVVPTALVAPVSASGDPFLYIDRLNSMLLTWKEECDWTRIDWRQISESDTSHRVELVLQMERGRRIMYEYVIDEQECIKPVSIKMIQWSL